MVSLNPHRFVEAISQSGLSIYDPIEIGDPDIWIPTPELEFLLNEGLRGISLANLPIRTRSKVVKQQVCNSLGYPIPKSFKKTQPRFPGQSFDIYVQKSNNLQIWNEEVSITRRYVLIQVASNNIITNVKVVTGDILADLDTTGTLTQKYQARCIVGNQQAELISARDTGIISPFVSSTVDLRAVTTPISYPQRGQLLPIDTIFHRLSGLVGTSFENVGFDQERNRGAALHQLACNTLGFSTYQDDGRFPDIRHQLLEIKLQTSPTIDLGLICPNSVEALDVPKIQGQQIRHCDVRYAVFYAQIEDKHVTLTHLFVSTGEDFFSRFPQFQGNVLNRKLQIHLPARFFST
ncbi:hypothetical protein SPSYN_00912 [Sporotomaculum syntrophicum]|uniref:Restriction endonuclease n=1 Tax=Sporotomaculum syntrophicum TaxID=182264 RepID=A0A9D3AZ49_9FIRM|nr:restriction endonuclease [Sporotomaculum syntrophicum]KAF1086171.1 hypothetical protein SPSYN_00912 [Sporotomaculum syntrophicum]